MCPTHHTHLPTELPTCRRHRAASYPIGYKPATEYPDTLAGTPFSFLTYGSRTGIGRVRVRRPALPPPVRRGRIGGLVNDLLLCFAFGSHSPSPISLALISRFLRRLLLSPLAAPIPSPSPSGGCCPDFTHQTTLPQRLLSIPTFLISWIHSTDLSSSCFHAPHPDELKRKGKGKTCEYPGVSRRT